MITGDTARRQQTMARLLLAVASIAVVIIWVRLFVRPSSDLLNHQEFGRRFVAGTFLYDGGLNYPYLPTWAMAHAPLAAVPPSLVSALVFPIGLASLVALLWMLDRLSRRDLPLDDHRTLVVTAAAVALSSRFVIRDLVDGGENLALTTLAWGALYALRREQRWASAGLLGTAIALKLTAGVFLIVLLARRAYVQAARAALAAATIVVLPAVWMGIDRYTAHMELWLSKVTSGLLWSDATFGVLGPEPIGNVGLRPAVGRWMAALASDNLRDTSSAAAMIGVAVLTLIVIVVSARRADTELDDAVVWASAGVLALLASPITWRAHLVAILPACYLLLRRWTVDGRLFRAGLAALIAVGVPGIVLARGVTGEAVSQWSDGWSVTTLALIVLLMGVCAWPARR